MPLPSATITRNEFGNQYGAINNQMDGGRFLAAQVTNLGNQLSASLSENAMRKEATAMAPQIANSYRNGFEQIQAGNLGGGLGEIYSTSAMAAQNPFLARMAQDATQAAGYIANSTLKNKMLTNEYGLREQLQADRFNGYSALQEDRQAHDIQMKQDYPTGSSGGGITPNAYRAYWNTRQKVVDDLEEARVANDSAKVDQLYERLASEDQLALQNGMKIVQDDGQPFLTQDQTDKINKAREAFNSLSDKSSEAAKKAIGDYNDLMKMVEKKGEALVEKAKARLPQNPVIGPDNEPLPVDMTQQNDIVPVVPQAASTLSAQDQEALDWAIANPKDPRAAQIKQKLGVQ